MSDLAARLREATDLNIYDRSVTNDDCGATYFLAKAGAEKVIGSVGEGVVSGTLRGQIDGRNIVVGDCDAANAANLRSTFPWTAPQTVGLDTSAGLGDRLGLATPGHIRAVRQQGGKIAPLLAQQSIREMTRTQRTPVEVMDDATFGVFQEGWRDGFGSDADHLQTPEDINATAAVGFTMFTIDPSAHVNDAADSLDTEALARAYAGLNFDALETTADDLSNTYNGKSFDLEGGRSVDVDGEAFLRAAVKYGNAIGHVARMYRHLADVCDGEFEVEVSVDETERPTSVAEHYFFADQLKRLSVPWVSLAPRFVGRMEKGVDYIGDVDVFADAFRGHVAVMRTLGPYKISIHSGSDKFSIYPVVAEMTDGLVHLKTAGTSYLEAIRAIATIDPPLFREIYDFARERWEEDRKTYHVSADLSKVRSAADLPDEHLPAVVDEFDARQVLHCTFGSVLTADGGERFKARMCEELKRDEEAHYDLLAEHLGKHLSCFADHAEKA
ncbi:MAG: hypothetical protein GVY16_02700 [Planctomycetes bacterium]|jgi:hypothetical protein|nr:hypothetical protein [Planctomycetota bacterium]